VVGRHPFVRRDFDEHGRRRVVASTHGIGLLETVPVNSAACYRTSDISHDSKWTFSIAC
jgi:hypothetical protein